MTETSIQTALGEAVVDVLEKMFFVEATAVTPEFHMDVPGVHVQLGFEGDPPGVFHVSLPRAAASLIAADFLGEDAEVLTDARVDEVAKELANMICGAVLSRIESSATFRLASPCLVPSGAGQFPGTRCTVETGNGPLTAGIFMESRICTPIAKSAS